MSEDSRSLSSQSQEDFEILVEWPDEDTAGIRKVSLGDPIDLLRQYSKKALDTAMQTVSSMSREVAATIKEIPENERPSEAEVTFGIVLDTQLGARLAKTGAKAHMTVKLSWKAESLQG